MRGEAQGKVSSITITYNEEENIGDCLKSISWCDEHIVIDGFSEDNTVEIAESYGANVFQMETPESANTFDILRKEAIERASNNWILRIDADERSHPKLNNRLQDLVNAKGVEVVEVPRMTFLGDNWIKTGKRWWPDRSPVLFHVDSMNIRDRIHRFMIPREDARVIELPAEQETAVYHYSYESLPDLIKRRWRYAGIEAEVYDDPFYFALFFFFSDFIEGVVVDRGFLSGPLGFLVPAIDSIYNILVLIRSHIHK